MATGTAIYPSTSTFPGTDVYPGQGLTPAMVARLSFSGARTSSPTWVDVSSRVRAFSIDRGGENELELIDTGTTIVVLDNRDRALDPFNTSSPYSPNVKPRRRLWLQSQWDGQTIDRFYGWTGAFKPEWPGGGTDAVVNLTAQDGFAILAGDALPTTSPPRDSYAEVILSDLPYGYWPLNEPAAAEGKSAADASGNGRDLFAQLTTFPTPGQNGMIVGERDTAMRFSLLANILYMRGGTTDEGTIGNFAGKQAVSAEFWIRLVSGGVGGTPLSGLQPASGNTQYRLGVSTGSGWFSAGVNTSGGNVQIQSTTPPQLGIRYHIAMVYNGSTLKIYVNGVEESSTAITGTIDAPNAGALGSIGNFGDHVGDLQHVALYSQALSASRILAHYNAGVNRGHGQDTTDQHIADALSESGLSFVPRQLRTGQRQMQPIYFSGQDPKGWIEDAVRTEGDPAMFFFAGDGAAVFLDRDHRSASPWSTVQATFDDDGTDLPYRALEIDDGEAFIYNDVRVTARGGELQQSTDTASIDEYQRRVLDRGETLNVSDADADAEGDALLAKYKDPLARITALELTGGDPAVLTAMLAREIGDRIRVFRRPVGGGSAIDQTSFIRKIRLSGDAGDPYWTCVWSVSSR